MLRFLFLITFTVISISFTGSSKDKPYYHKVIAEPGDIIFTLLKRYYLNQHECNFDRFYELNKLKHRCKN